VVHIKVYAHFDGFLSIPDGDPEEEMEKILGEIQSRNPDDLEREVYQEIGFLL
jgi:hypothetical protein